MSTFSEPRPLERSQFFDGQRLFASDLQALEEFNREMRWLHNRSLHQPGIAQGLAVVGKKGDRLVTVRPGVALDARGREIVLNETRVLPVPPVADDGYGGPVSYDLTISYPNDRDMDETETREGVCGPTGAVRLRETPQFCWVKLGAPPERLAEKAPMANAVGGGIQLRLARAAVLNCQLDQPLSLAQRRNARPPEQPYVACGILGGVEWSVSADAAFKGIGRQITAWVDTRRADFRTPPCYTASIIGERLYKFANAAPRFLDGFLTLGDGKPSGFQVSVLIPQALFAVRTNIPNDTDPSTLPDFEKELKKAASKWSIQWMGVEG